LQDPNVPGLGGNLQHWLYKFLMRLRSGLIRLTRPDKLTVPS